MNLTPREKTVARLLAAEFSPAEIAVVFCTSRESIQVVIGSLRRKLDIRVPGSHGQTQAAIVERVKANPDLFRFGPLPEWMSQVPCEKCGDRHHPKNDRRCRAIQNAAVTASRLRARRPDLFTQKGTPVSHKRRYVNRIRVMKRKGLNF